MIGRIAAGMIVAFWVGMMVALVRLEFFPEPLGVGDVPPEVVLRKVFTHEEDTRLNVFYQGSGIGFCKVEILPIFETASNVVVTTNEVAQARLTGYNVRSELTLTLSLLGAPSRLRLVGDSRFNPAYQMDAFHLNTAIGDGTIEVRGDARTNKMMVDFEFGDLKDHRVFDFAQVRGAGLASAMGLPGLANFSFLGGGGMPTAFAQGGPGGGNPPESSTRIYLTDLRVGTIVLRTYLVESKFDQNMWARMWISERGEVLKVETSVGLTMLADVLSDQSLVLDRRERDSDAHDSY